ncbi:MAG: hypothetical protein KA419_11520 [Acidobacteria bacterium]|nr:hypothetical protein [Acidobacteriota bacterium]
MNSTHRPSHPLRLLAAGAFLLAAVAACPAMDLAPTLGPDALKQLEGWKARLNLSEAQRKKVAIFVDDFVLKIEPLVEKLQSEQMADRRVGIREGMTALTDFQTAFEGVLTPSQKMAWEKFKTEGKGLLRDVLGDRMAARLKKTYALSDAQVKDCVPFLTREVAAMITLMDAFRAAKQQGKSKEDLKAQGSLDLAREARAAHLECEAAFQKIFTPEQWKRYQADKNQQKQQMRQNAIRSRG